MRCVLVKSANTKTRKNQHASNPSLCNTLHSKGESELVVHIAVEHWPLQPWHICRWQPIFFSTADGNGACPLLGSSVLFVQQRSSLRSHLHRLQFQTQHDGHNFITTSWNLFHDYSNCKVQQPEHWNHHPYIHSSHPGSIHLGQLQGCATSHATWSLGWGDPSTPAMAVGDWFCELG